jgi:N-acyl-D-aspartate/D-glutamate deacylase
MTRDVDLLLEGGTVIDGTGAPGYRSSVAVAGDRIVLPGPADAVRAARTIDASGLVVAPGFIDLHSHGGLVMLAEPRHEPKVRQGVTTEVIGVDGNAYAPFPDPADLRDFVVLNAGLDGRPDIAYDWATVAEYLGRYERRVAVNVAYVAGNSALRIAALGWDDVEADDRAIADQRARLREAMEDGAFGLSTGLDPTRRAVISRQSPPRPRDSAASTTRTCGIRWATDSWTRSGRPSRSAGEAERPSTSRTSTTGRRSPGRPSRCWRWWTTRAPRAWT